MFVLIYELEMRILLSPQIVDSTNTLDSHYQIKKTKGGVHSYACGKT